MVERVMTAASRLEIKPAPFSGDMDGLAASFAVITLAAGEAIMRVYAENFAVRCKADKSPVCDADLNAEALILAALEGLIPDVPVIAEEAVSRGEIPAHADRFILVDPLDGTEEFVKRNGEFTVNIALVADGTPRCGAVYAPVSRKLWFAGRRAYACEAQPGGPLPPRAAWTELHSRRPPSEGLVALVSRSHCNRETEGFLQRLPIRGRRSAGSSLKFCSIAAAEADVYPRFGPTMEWDTAAGDAVLRAAGGIVLTADGSPLTYDKAATGFRNPAFVAWGDRETAAESMEACDCLSLAAEECRAEEKLSS
jgi:3'(2'), 5'-bisphosphate nucleotidase